METNHCSQCSRDIKASFSASAFGYLSHLRFKLKRYFSFPSVHPDISIFRHYCRPRSSGYPKNTTQNVRSWQSSRENSCFLSPRDLLKHLSHRRHPHNRLRPLGAPRKYIRTSLPMAPPPPITDPSLHGPSCSTSNPQLEFAARKLTQRTHRNIIRPTQSWQQTSRQNGQRSMETGQRAPRSRHVLLLPRNISRLFTSPHAHLILPPAIASTIKLAYCPWDITRRSCSVAFSPSRSKDNSWGCDNRVS